jgi:hypothetical protein
MSHGIKETKDALKFVVSLGNAVDKALEDKKINMMDVPLFMDPMIKIAPAFENIGMVAKEIGDLDAAERAELVKYVEDELDLRSDDTEKMIERGLSLVSLVYEFIKGFKKD